LVFHGPVLEWFKSYLSDRCFHIKCENSFSFSHTCSCGVPQGSVFGPLLFVLYTTSLITFISSLSLNHYLYADHTQPFSFYSSDLESSITHLQNALQHISSWVTANLLTLNSSKTEFLLIGLKQQQLAKISSCSLDTAYSARNLGFIIDEQISFFDQISALSKSCYSHICQFAASIHISITKQPVSLPPLLSTPSLTTATHFTTTYQTLN